MHAQAVFLKLSLLCLLAMAVHSQISSCNLTATNTNVGGTTSHSFLCSLQGFNITTTNSYMLVVYSANWGVSSITRGATGDFCETGCTIGSVTTINTSNSIKVMGLIPNQMILGAFSVRYTLGNIANPLFRNTESITVAFYTSADVLISTNTVSLNINPAMMTCVASPTDPTVGATTSYTFTVTPGLTLPSSGYMRMTFPSNWRNSLTGPAFTFTDCAGTVSCVPTGSNFTVTNLISSASSSPFSFTFNSINNPGTVETNTDLLFTYFYSNHSQISYCTVPITSLSPPSLVGVTFSIINNTGILTYNNLFTPLLSDQMLITLPSEISISQFRTVDVFHGSSSNSLTPTPRIITGTNHISFAPYGTSLITNTTVLLKQLYFLKPATTANLTFALRRGTNTYSFTNCCSLTQNSTQSMTLQVTLTNSMLKAPSQYMLTFAPTYYDIDYLILDFGSAFSLSVGNTYPCYIATLTTSSQMICTVTNSTLIRATLNPVASFASLFGFASNYTLVITGLTNPSQRTATLNLSSYYLPGSQLQYSNIVTVNYSLAKIPNAAITTSSSQVGATATYTFAINNTNSLLPNSKLRIQFPRSFTITNLSCTTNSVSSICNPFNSSYLIFNLPNAAIASYGLTAYTLSVLNVVNPNSLMPSPSFGLELQSGADIVEAIYDGVVVKMGSLAHFTNSSLIVTPSNLNVGNLASYRIDFAHSLTIAPTSTATLSFQLPTGLILASCTACTSFQTIPITQSNSSVNISGIYNPQQITVPTSILVTLSIDGYQSIQDFAPSITFTALTTDWSLKADSVYLGDPVKLNFTIRSFPLNTQFFVVTIPAAYGLGGVTTYTEGSMACTCTRTLAVLNCSVSSINSINTTLIIQGLTNPTVTSSTPWKIDIYAATAILISSQSSSIQFIAPCGSNCRNCTNASFCLSCYSNALVNNEAYLSKTSNKCVSSCGSSEFLQGTICYKCNNTCLTCSAFSANCTSCASGAFLYAGSCISTCPSAYYTSGQTCLACINHCATCNSSTVCISCSISYILQNDSSCQANCPSGRFNKSNICTVCPSNCLTCDSIGCLTCAPSFLLTTFSNPSCVSACPTSTYISGSICQTCQAPCLTCSINSNNCTACHAGSGFPFLFNFTCIPGCLGQTYADELNQCQPCQSPCLDCINRNQCTSCASPLLYYAANNQCLTSCFSNTIDVGGTCRQCLSPCLTCTGNINICSSCIENYFLSGTTCVTNCSAPLVIDAGVCSPCYSPCLTCPSGSPYSCSTCIGGYFKLSTSCYAACPAGSYASSANACSLCTPPCSQCSGSDTTCTGCFLGSYLLNNTCYYPCPPTYYPNNVTCRQCEPQCLACTHTASDECSVCSSATYYYNPINYHCTVTCDPPYYAHAADKICELCQLPCKSCIGLSSTCIACYSGYFLKNQQCLTLCGNGFYENSTDNTCGQCPVSCATCDIQKCFTCTPTAYFFDGMCYNVCPAQAPNVFGIYCRNCLKDNCIKCNSEGACTICLPNTYNYKGECLAGCPSDYEPDLATNSQCVMRSDIAYFQYIKGLQSSKIWITPSSSFFLLSLPLLYFASSKLYCFAFILTAPQALSLIQLTANYIHEWELLSIPILPYELMFIALGVHMLSSIIYTMVVKRHLEKDESFARWVNYGSNRLRYYLVIISGCFSKQVLFILFSGLFNLPFTSFRFKPFRWFYLLHSSSLVTEVGLLVIAFLLAIYQDTANYNNKLFYSSLDVLIVHSTALAYQIAFMVLLEKQPAVEAYTKYVLPNVSNKELPALSDYNDNLPEEVTHNNLHRSGSDQEMLESEQMKNVKFMSQFDPDEYYDETPRMALDKVPQAVDDGKFRKKEKKKRGQRRLGKLNLDIIDQEEEIEDKAADKKKKKASKKEDIGGLKNYLYWKKPAAKKHNPGLVFKENENEIMSRIKEKQSEFDSITQNDIIFQEDFEENSSEDSYNIQGDSRRILHRPSYDNYFNLNYASKKHLGQE